MWRFALARRWWVGHLLVTMCCALFIWLGRWQWGRALSPTGDWQNLGYALQWPLFTVVLALAWVRFLWLEHHRGPTVNRTPPVPRKVPQNPADPPLREDDPDDELAAYNAYLARLAEQDQP